MKVFLYKLMLMKSFLLALFISVSLSSILAFADSEDDIISLHDKGVDLVNTGNYEEAILYFDKALEINPNDVHVLNSKGWALNLMENYYEAKIIFDKILYGIPNFLPAQIGQLHAIGNMYKYVDGTLEITIHNQQGQLVGYLLTPNLKILDHDIAKEEIDKWEVIDTISRNGQNFKVLQREYSFTVPSDEIQHINKLSLSVPEGKTSLIFGIHNGILLQKYDLVTLVFTIVRPIE